MPGIYETLFGREGQFKKSENQFNPQQQDILSQLLGMGAQGLGTDAIEGKARRGFQQNTIPLLSERFANVAGRGLSGIGSSGYQNALQGAGTRLETKLAALRQGNAMNLLGLGLTPQQETYFEPGSQGILGPLALLGADAGLTYLTGGANKAGSILDYFKSLFGNNAEQATETAPAESPVKRILENQPATRSLEQATNQRLSRLGAPLFAGGKFTYEQPLGKNQFDMMEKYKNYGKYGGINLLRQTADATLPGGLRSADMTASLNRYYPGFEL